MSDPAAIYARGGCCCGQVRYHLTAAPLRMTVCHCLWCQRRTGTAFGAELVFAFDQVRFDQAMPAAYRHVSDESGRWLDTHFCARCGSHLGLTLEAAPELRTIAAGTLDDPARIDREDIEIRQVYHRSRRAWTNEGRGPVYATHFRAPPAAGGGPQ